MELGAGERKSPYSKPVVNRALAITVTYFTTLSETLQELNLPKDCARADATPRLDVFLDGARISLFGWGFGLCRSRFACAEMV